MVKDSVEPRFFSSSIETLTIGVTSHRNLVAGEVAEMRLSVGKFLAALQRKFLSLPLTVVSSLASGGDQLVAEEALAMGALLVAPLPFPRENYARDFTDPADRDRFEALCARATVIELPAMSASLLGIDEGDPRARAWHYAQAGMYVASHCHVLLAIWDGKNIDRLGGTAQIVRYHLTGIKPELIERRHHASVDNPLGESNERLAFHIVCSRDEPDGAPAAHLQPLQTFWRTGDQSVDGTLPMPVEFRSMFTRISELNEDATRYAARVEAAARDVSHQHVQTTARRADSPIERRFAVADWLAMHFQRRVLFAMRSTYSLAALMGIAFISYDQLSWSYMIFVFLALFAAGVGVDVVARRRSWHRKYLDYRALAEVCACRRTGGGPGCR